MSRIRSRDTDPELLLRRAMWGQGLRYRVHLTVDGVRCDIAFPRSQLAVFVDGCFWHGCPLHYVRPRTRTCFWSQKLRDNVARDRRQTSALESAGWRVERVWEHELALDPSRVATRISAILAGTPHDDAVGEHWQVISVTPLDQGGCQEQRVLCELRGRAPERTLMQDRTTAKW